MGNYLYHINENGPAICRAGKRACPLGGEHFKTKGAASMVYEETMNGKLLQTMSKAPKKVTSPNRSVEAFSENNYYGVLPPRHIQIDAMNGVIKALEEDDATQLIAACGTGKTYMQRQVLNKIMSEEGATGIGVILTSNIKLAKDTANDLRPVNGFYDETFGRYGKDYEVIEVHSGVSYSRVELNGELIERPSVLQEGVISIERIKKQLSEAKEAGKKVVIVSTYDSVAKVQKAQCELNDERFDADLIVHDEAHNILGQQKPTTISKNEENELTAYVGFHNDIPGALQARKRLYSTATPVIRENLTDKEEVETLGEAIEIAKKMQAGDQYSRITYYSSNEDVVGKMGGFISQNDAIAAGFLAKPVYSIREEALKGEIKNFDDPVINPDGTIIEKSESAFNNPLTPKTYGALKSTLNALTEDYNGGMNPPQNVLAYVGSINQAEGFKEAFKSVALEMSGGMSSEEAKQNINSSDGEVRRRARIRLIHDNAVVMAAHSRTDGESVREREAAFKMFNGNAIDSSGWSPNKRILANVDIFSEGVSIPEIDTVVVTDDDKFNERAMTQSIGRAIRTVPGNNYKKYGHVIIPEVKDEKGVSFNSASVNLAAYTATRVERAVTPNKLLGRSISKDTTTTFNVYKNGGVSQVGAVDFAQSSIKDVTDIAVANEIYNIHTRLVEDDKANEYKQMNHRQQMQVIKSVVNERISRELNKTTQSDASKDNHKYYTAVLERMNEKTPHELRNISRNGRVLSGALSSGDVSSVNPELTKLLMSSGVLKTQQETPQVTLDEKRKLLSDYKRELSYAVLTTPSEMSDHHRMAQHLMGEDYAKIKPLAKGPQLKAARGDEELTEESKKIIEAFDKSLANDEFVEHMFEVASNSSERQLPILNNLKRAARLKEDKDSIEAARLQRQQEAAANGEQSYEIDQNAVKKTGELTTNTIKKLFKIKTDGWGEI